MPPIVKFLLRRLLAFPITLILITAVLYGIIMLAPIETRAALYMPSGSNNPNADVDAIRAQIVEEKGLNDPYPLQYARWALALTQGDWGWSPNYGDVLTSLVRRTPATMELTLYSVLFLVPLGIISGGMAGAKQNRPTDHVFRLAAFIGTAIPPFILALILMGVFYAGLNWFPPGRLDYSEMLMIEGQSFRTYTGLLTIDGMLNGQPDITISAFRHLILPAITLSVLHWATLGRVTRTAMIEELSKQYIMAGWGRGLPRQAIVWNHALRNAMLPALNSIALSAASLIMGVFVIERIYNFPGVSEMTQALAFLPDPPVMMGFAIYSVLLVLPVMLILDLLQAAFDPRVREGVTDS
ncbi:MAG: ABC transporter permease [Anaerolineae bacterium]|nr:ABC transporter permease [Anaerolineae bacterium]